MYCERVRGFAKNYLKQGREILCELARIGTLNVYMLTTYTKFTSLRLIIGFDKFNFHYEMNNVRLFLFAASRNTKWTTCSAICEHWADSFSFQKNLSHHFRH